MVSSAIGIALLAAALVAVGELLHRGRCRRIALLAFPGGAPRPWTAVAPALRITAASLLAWGLSTLLLNNPAELAGERGVAEREQHDRAVQRGRTSQHRGLRGARGEVRGTRGERGQRVLHGRLALLHVLQEPQPARAEPAAVRYLAEGGHIARGERRLDERVALLGRRQRTHPKRAHTPRGGVRGKGEALESKSGKSGGRAASFMERSGDGGGGASGSAVRSRWFLGTRRPLRN